MESRALFRLSVAFLASAFACPVHALQDGAYDPNFGTIGRTWIDAGPDTNDIVTTSLVRLPGGKLFMAGYCGLDPCAVWLTPSGAPLAGFGAAGTGTGSLAAYLGWPPNATYPSDAAAFADGRVVLITTKDLILLRADGTGLDPSVGNGAGYVGPVSAPLSALERVLVTPQQQVIVAGSTATSPRQFIVARYDSTFHLDTSFGTSGSTAIGFDDGDASPNQMILQRDGKIVVIGTIGDSKALAIIRLTAGGAPDPAFGVNSDGRFESTFGNNGAGGTGIVEDKKGRLVISGYAQIDSDNEKWLVTRLLSGGALDPNFNGGSARQFTIFDTTTVYQARTCCVKLQSDNRIVVAGRMDRPSDAFQAYFAIARFNEEGTFDSTWGNGGQSYGDMSTQAPNVIGDYPRTMLISDGGIIIGGDTITHGERRFSPVKARTDLLLASDFE